jgi:hypothetical protein
MTEEERLRLVNRTAAAFTRQHVETVMRRTFPENLILAGVLGVSLPAAAHIEYYDLNQGLQIASLTAAGRALVGNSLPISDPAYWTVAYQNSTDSGETWVSRGGSYASGTWGYGLTVVNMDSSSWTDGLRTNLAGGANLLGDSHKLGFANFHLDKASNVSITVSDALAGSGYGLNPSISLFRGSIVYQAHDGAGVDPLNPRMATPPFSRVQSVKDAGNAVDSQGITSPYRNTVLPAGIEYIGQFDALGGWSAGNESGDWSAVEFLAAATGFVNANGTGEGNANTNSLTDLLLGPGNYIIAFGGNATPVSYANLRSGNMYPFGAVSGFTATLTVDVAAVPEPETWAMLVGGLAFVGVTVRRKRR